MADGCCPEACDSASDLDCQSQFIPGDEICQEALGEDCRNSPDCLGDGFKGECCGDGVCEKFESRRGTCPEDCG